MASESKLRQSNYVRRSGCNVFEEGKISSHPLSIWTEDDIWAYIRKYDIPYCELYNANISHTGCACCGFGCTLKGDQRFHILYRLYPGLYNMCMNYTNNGYTYRRVLTSLGIDLPDTELSFKD